MFVEFQSVTQRPYMLGLYLFMCKRSTVVKANTAAIIKHTSVLPLLDSHYVKLLVRRHVCERANGVNPAETIMSNNSTFYSTLLHSFVFCIYSSLEHFYTRGNLYTFLPTRHHRKNTNSSLFGARVQRRSFPAE